jgi:hypothetical protein
MTSIFVELGGAKILAKAINETEEPSGWLRLSPENSGRSSNLQHRYTALSSELAIFMPPWSTPWGAWATLMELGRNSG